MNKSTYELVEQFVVDAFTRAEKSGNIRHLQRTVYWVEQLRPDADEALRCAAVAHDIERAFKKVDTEDLIRSSPQGYRDEYFLKIHQEESAKTIAEFLRGQGVESEFITRVIHLVSRHEIGGDDDQNILKDADSMSFFENNTDRFLAHWIPMLGKYGKEKVRAKFQWMFDRITSPEARSIAYPWHEEAMKKLDT